MDGPTPLEPEIEIIGLTISDGFIDVAYIEKRNVTPRAFKKEEISILLEDLPEDEVADFLDTLQQWIDSGLRTIRDGRSS